MLLTGLELGLVATADRGDGLGRRNTSSRTITCQHEQSQNKIQINPTAIRLYHRKDQRIIAKSIENQTSVSSP